MKAASREDRDVEKQLVVPGVVAQADGQCLAAGWAVGCTETAWKAKPPRASANPEERCQQSRAPVPHTLTQCPSSPCHQRYQKEPGDCHPPRPQLAERQRIPLRPFWRLSGPRMQGRTSKRREQACSSLAVPRSGTWPVSVKPGGRSDDASAGQIPF